VAPEDLEITDGFVHPVGAPSRGVAVRELAERLYGLDSAEGPIAVHGSVVPAAYAPAAAVHLAHVRADPETGQARVVSYVALQDVGRALNPALVDGQIRGGVAQGIGWALLEELVIDEHGQLLTGSLLDYAIPAFEDVPAIETVPVEVPSPDGPFGARGVGEAPVIPVAAAVANAIAAATGLRPRQLPMTSERLWRARAG
jgi:CO/xanthine dehydrogenase Mo-binding subunit